MNECRNNRGFTLMEAVVVLVITGILAALVIPRLSSTSQFDLTSNAEVIKSHLFYAQGMAMKQGIVAGIKCDGSSYWLFKTNAPDDAANQILLPGVYKVDLILDTAKISLSSRKATLTAFTLFFDFAGRPYTDAAVNTPISAPLVLTVGVTTGPGTANISITPETGFIQ